MKKLLIGLGVVLLLVAGVVALVGRAYLADTSKLEALATDMLGRKVGIGSISELRFGRQSSVVVRELSIANPPWAERSSLLNIEYARIHLNLLSLFADGPVIIDDLELSGVRVNLYAPEGRDPSWQLDAVTAGGEDNAAPAEGGMHLPVYLAQAHITDSRIVYRDPTRDITADLVGQLEGGDGIVLSTEGVADGAAIDFKGHLYRRDNGATLTARGLVAGWVVEADIALADPLAFAGLDGSLRAGGEVVLGEGDSARNLPVELALAVTGDSEALRLRNGSLTAGQSVLEASGNLGNLRTLDGMALSLWLNSFDLRELLATPTLTEPATLELTGRLESDGQRLLLRDIAGRGNDGRVTGEAELSLADGFAGSRARLNAHGEDMAQLLRPWFPNVPVDAPYDVDVAALWQPPVVTLEQLQIAAGENKVNAVLDIDTGGSRLALSGKLKASGKRAHKVLRSVGVESPLPDDSYLLSGQVALTGSGELQLRDLDVQLGASELRGEAFFRPGTPATVRATLVAPRLDLRFLARPSGDTGTGPKRNYSDTADLTNRQLADRMIADTPIDFSWLSRYQGEVSLRVDQIVYADNIASKGQLELVMADGKWSTQQLNWQGEFSSGEAQVTLREHPSGAAIDLSVDSKRLPLLWMATGNTAPGSSIRYRSELAAVGGSSAELAAGLNGKLVIRGSGGRFNNSGLTLLLGDLFGEIFSRIDPASAKAPYTNVECQAGVISIIDGTMDLTPGLVVRTDTLDIGVGGSVNLDNEQLNLVFNTRARTGVGISASKAVTPYVKLGGNFSHPRVGVNAKGVVVSGGLAVATGGMSILAEGMWDRWIATAANPCEAIFNEVPESSESFRKLLGRP